MCLYPGTWYSSQFPSTVKNLQAKSRITRQDVEAHLQQEKETAVDKKLPTKEKKEPIPTSSTLESSPSDSHREERVL